MSTRVIICAAKYRYILLWNWESTESTSVECRSHVGNGTQSLRLVTTPPYWATLAGCSWVSHVQAGHHGVQLPAWSRACVLVELCQLVAGVASRQHLRSATQQLLVVLCHQLSSYVRWAFCVAGPSVWNSLPDSLRNLVIGGNSFRQSQKTFLFATYWCIQRIRGSATMRYISRLFTYLLTYSVWDYEQTVVALWIL